MVSNRHPAQSRTDAQPRTQTPSDARPYQAPATVALKLRQAVRSSLAGRNVSQGIYISRDDQLKMLRDRFYWPIPPCQCFQACDHLRIEPLLERFGRVAAYDGIGRHIRNDNRARRNDSAIANMHTGHDERVVAYPDIIADYRVALVRQLFRFGHDLFRSEERRVGEQ